MLIKNIVGANAIFYDWTVNNVDWKSTPENIQYAFYREDTTLFIRFQGTVSISDWIKNFKFWATPLFYVRRPYKNMGNKIWFAHAGFVECYKSVREIIYNEIGSFKDITEIIISGYSQGAAITILCHEDMMYNYPYLNIRSYVFASPKVIWWPFSWNVKERLDGLTIINARGDIVAAVPPIFFGYAHVAEEKIKFGPYRYLPLAKYHKKEYYLKHLNLFSKE